MQTALLITVTGIGITFGAILLFWGLIWLLTARPEKAESAGAPAAPTVDEAESLARAAAAAVSLALAEENAARHAPLPPTPLVSAWQLGMRTRQMSQHGARRKTG